MRKTITIIIIIFISVGLGYTYEQVTIGIEKERHPVMYEEFVEKYSYEYAVPKEIIYSVIKAESSFRSDVVSEKGAVGLMQITPETFDWLMTKTKENLSQGLLYEPETNIKYGTYFLYYLYTEFEVWDIVFAAYNAGYNRVKNEWMKNPEYIYNNQVIDVPYPETRNYIKRVNGNMEMYKKLYFTEK